MAQGNSNLCNDFASLTVSPESLHNIDDITRNKTDGNVLILDTILEKTALEQDRKMVEQKIVQYTMMKFEELAFLDIPKRNKIVKQRLPKAYQKEANKLLSQFRRRSKGRETGRKRRLKSKRNHTQFLQLRHNCKNLYELVFATLYSPTLDSKDLAKKHYQCLEECAKILRMMNLKFKFADSS